MSNKLQLTNAIKLYYFCVFSSSFQHAIRMKIQEKEQNTQRSKM